MKSIANVNTTKYHAGKSKLVTPQNAKMFMVTTPNSSSLKKPISSSANQLRGANASKLTTTSAKKLTRASTMTNSSTPSSINVVSALGVKLVTGKLINFKVQIRCTSEKFDVNNFPIQTKIRDLKGLLEFICGIPFNLQRLSYLDDGELVDSRELQYYDVIDGAELMLDVWTIYVGLVQASVFGSLDDALKQGVSNKVEWHSPTSDYMFRMDKNKYIQERGGISLFIASHRGNLELVKGLLNYGADVNYMSAFGRTPIMISVVADKPEIIDFLLAKDADIEMEDINGETALTIARKFNNRLGQHKLAQYKWRKRTDAEAKAKNKAGSENGHFGEDRLPHQIFDSSKKTWLKGDFMQLYMMQLVPLGEFSGSGFSAPKSIGAEVLKQHRLTKSNEDLKFTAEKDENGETIISPRAFTFERWLAEKMKEKRKAKEKLIKSEKAAQELAQESKEEAVKEAPTSSDADKNNWMKDYLEMRSHKLSKYDLFEMENRRLNESMSKKNMNNSTAGAQAGNNAASKSFSNTSQSFNKESTRSSLKNFDVFNIYKGMPYDEWAKIRDEFLKAHNMV